MCKPSGKRLVWIASSQRDMRALPKGVRRTFGVALYAAQTGVTPPIAKPLKGFGGAGVLELIEDDKGGTYRAVYTVRYATALYVLHVFQKKSKQGIATPQQDIDLIKDRLKIAEAIHKETYRETEP
ncbi:type II toxin-antitoxin system RelE/ParE family toxin [Blastochloris sulfoviridis]|uniref:Type II toxin-antitoxin system RelE/ParE family toxin n=1 Tax=Blastochloris sulfoviridis TaxID=50712 RepID=A0A5M6I2X6_9HYPH|nr:type II toxin-antitoxin system RelE/ParE family toxin [Blastochloris sulfoviridis]KAA5602239.1 type II toxin-antitoxin system RelE/ParE family toxin [Blastochloris sulfoviridis]